MLGHERLEVEQRYQFLTEGPGSTCPSKTVRQTIQAIRCLLDRQRFLLADLGGALTACSHCQKRLVFHGPIISEPV
jgi:hypothetical protein